MPVAVASHPAPSLELTPAKYLRRRRQFAVLEAVITKRCITTQTATDFALPIGRVVKTIADVLSGADKRMIVDSLSPVGRLVGFYKDEADRDRRPYTVALDTNFPGWTSDPSPVLRLGLSHQSMPLVVAALTFKRESLHQLVEPLTPKQVVLVLRLTWLSMACPDMRFAFSQ